MRYCLWRQRLLSLLEARFASEGVGGTGRHQPLGIHRSSNAVVDCARAAKSGCCKLGPMANLDLVALVVRDYDPAIRFFVDVLQFELVEDTPSLTNDGRPKRWVVVRPVGAQGRITGESAIDLPPFRTHW